LKICKNKSCSIFKDLQLSQYEHFPIRLSFWNLNLNSKRDIFGKSEKPKLLWILYWNFKNSKYQSCTSRADLQLCYSKYFQIMPPFWNWIGKMKRGQFWDLNLFKITSNFTLKLWKLKTSNL
jgi:hypothetical protein